MSKNVVIVILALVVIGLGAYTLWYAPSTTTPQQTATTTEDTNDTEFCAQVITPARNPKTGDIKEYPTPCDVPEGWVVIQNDVPGLDLQSQ
jgi:hypothetical protein